MRSRFQREEDRAWAEQMVGGKRRWFTAVFANGLLLTILLGLPFARGLQRARASWQRYAAAASCLLGGKPAPQPGLGELSAVDARFGQQVLKAWVSGDKAWLTRCDRLLSEVAPEPAIFVWPPAKEGELRVREAVRVMRAELAKLRGYQGESRVPHDPVRALLQLRQELRGHAELAGVIDIPPQSAVTFPGPTGSLARPTRIPIYAGSDAVLSLWGDDDALSVVAVDKTGVSYLGTQAGEIRSVRHVRPALLEGFRRERGESHLLWALAREKCRNRTGGCEGKAMGISSADMPLTVLTPPRWIAAHPSGRLDRSVLPPVTNEGLWLISAEAASASELRGFALQEPSGGVVASELPPLRWAFAEPVQGTPLGLLQFSGKRFELLVRSSETSTTFVAHQVAGASAGTTELPLAALKPAELPWAAYCDDGQRAGVAVGTSGEIAMLRLEDQSVHRFEASALTLGNVPHERDPVRDRVQTVCLSDRIVAFARGADDKLWQYTCKEGDAGCGRSVLAEHVTSFATLDTGRALLVAFAGSDEHAQIRVQRLDRNTGKALGKAQIPSPCWDPRGGMCDQPRLHKLGARVLLSARDQTDLIALESPDDGVSWREVGGFPGAR